MFDLNTSSIAQELRQLARQVENLERRVLRRGLSAAYQSAWNEYRQDFPHIPKSAPGSQVTPRSFRERTRRVLAFGQRPMWAELRAEQRRQFLKLGVQGTLLPTAAKGVAVKARKQVFFRGGMRVLQDARLRPQEVFLAPVGAQRQGRKIGLLRVNSRGKLQAVTGIGVSTTLLRKSFQIVISAESGMDTALHEERL